MAHKKGLGSSKNGRDSNAQRLGVKRFSGEIVTGGSIYSRLGVLVSIDDFGTGYSSMSYLRRFPIDKLKIDRSFISEVTSNATDESIVRAIISLAHSLKLKVIAEGVETAAQLECLKALGCDQYQGFLRSAALPPAELEASLRAAAPAMHGGPIDATQSRLALVRAG